MPGRSRHVLVQRSILAVTLAGVAWACEAQVPTQLPPDAEPVEFELVSQLTRPFGGPNEPARLVIRDQAEWDEYWNALPTVVLPTPDPPAFDFSRDMVLIAAMGRRGSGGHVISVEGVYESGGELFVDVLEVSPGLGCITTQVMTAPLVGVRLAATQAPVRFLEQTESRPCS